MKKTLVAIALVATVGLTLTACGDNSEGDESAGSATSSELAAGFNDADVAFAQQMIPHHEQAIEMAEMAAGRASGDEVKELAARIEAAQGPEIETLEGWLAEWGEEASIDSGHGDMDHDAGMMDADDMNQLMDASGAAWDRMFLELMIEHHEGAVDMAQVEVDEGQSAGAVAMAEKIIRDQQEEITEMQELLDS